MLLRSCDGDDDCGDSSDEDNCPAQDVSCSAHEFRFVKNKALTESSAFQIACVIPVMLVTVTMDFVL